MENNRGGIDFHCDLLCKLLCNPDARFFGGSQDKLDVTFERLKQSGTDLQVFAIYIPEDREKTLTPILESVDLFYRYVASAPGTRIIRSRADMEACLGKGEMGIMLSLEGADGLQADFMSLRILYYLGIRSLGLTWNHANWAADGAMESRKGGLTCQGRRLVEACNELGIILDVSHLSEKAFWETIELSNAPCIASHSNAFSLCGHPRNLTDDQIQALILQDGMIGITFVPWFLREGGHAVIDDVIKHVEHVCTLGGEGHLMFGSDFDGIDNHVTGLAHPGERWRLKEALLKTYTEEQTQAFMGGNAARFLLKNLPV